MSRIAIPTIAIKLFAANPFQIGVFIGLTFLPFPTLGLFVGSILGEFIGLQSTILVEAALSGVAIVFVAVGPVVKLKKIPEQETSS